MRIHFSSVVTIFVMLLFISGTVGCRSNGGAWYNPKSYTWTNPFAKDNQAPPYMPDSFANANKLPSLDSQPNISNPPGGYSNESSLYSSRSGSHSGDMGGYSPDQGYQNSGSSPNPYGGYSIAEPSPYPPAYAERQPSGTNGPYQTETAQYGNPMPYGGNVYPGTEYHATSATSVNPNTHNYPPAMHSTSVDNYGVDPMGNYAPFGTMSPNDPYAAVQQPSTVPPVGFGDQPAHAPYPNQNPYPNGGVPVASPYPPYPPSTGGYNY